jgi:hypothetical protein
MDADFKYTWTIFTVTGTMHVNIKKMGLNAMVDFGTQQGVNQPFDLAPYLKVGALDVSLNNNDIDITLSGSLVSKIASVFIPLIKSSIIPQIIDTVKA